MGRARHLDASGTTTELVLNQRLRAPISKSTHGHLLWRMDALEMLASFARMRASLLALTEPSQTALRRAVLYGAQDLSTTPLGASPWRLSECGACRRTAAVMHTTSAAGGLQPHTMLSEDGCERTVRW